MDNHTAWTIESLKAHLEAQIAANRLRLEDLLSAETRLRLARRDDDLRAIDKAEVAMTRRLNSMNDLHSLLNEQAATFVTQSHFTAELDKLGALIERNRHDLEKTRELTLPRESFEVILREWSAWRAGIDTAILSRKGAEQGIAALGGAIVKLVAVVAGILTTVIVLANYFLR